MKDEKLLEDLRCFLHKLLAIKDKDAKLGVHLFLDRIRKEIGDG